MVNVAGRFKIGVTQENARIFIWLYSATGSWERILNINLISICIQQNAMSEAKILQ